MKLSCFTFLFLFILQNSFSQEKKELGPYNIKPAIDIPVTIGTGALSLVGFKFILIKKPALDSSYAASLHPGMISRFNRGATRTYSASAGRNSDIALFSSFALPGLLMLDKNIRSDAGKIGLLYLQTMGTMAVAYTWGVGLIYKNRPYIYNPDVPIEKKLRKRTTDSFFGGHPAAAAAATFFAAKVYHDYHPESKFKNVIWGAAIIPPIAVGYYRYKNGQHFPTDIIAGIPIGILIGIGIPELHRHRKISKKISATAFPGGGVISYTF